MIYLENCKTAPPLFFDDIGELQSRLDRIWFGEDAYPVVKLHQSEEALFLRAEIPGVSPEDLELDIKENTLRISFPRPVLDEELAVSERETGEQKPPQKISRTVRLPFRVDAELAKAELKNGVLKIEFVRAEEDKPKKILVAAAKG